MQIKFSGAKFFSHSADAKQYAGKNDGLFIPREDGKGWAFTTAGDIEAAKTINDVLRESMIDLLSTVPFPPEVHKSMTDLLNNASSTPEEVRDAIFGLLDKESILPAVREQISRNIKTVNLVLQRLVLRIQRRDGVKPAEAEA